MWHIISRKSPHWVPRNQLHSFFPADCLWNRKPFLFTKTKTAIKWSNRTGRSLAHGRNWRKTSNYWRWQNIAANLAVAQLSLIWFGEMIARPVDIIAISAYTSLWPFAYFETSYLGSRTARPEILAINMAARVLMPQVTLGLLLLISHGSQAGTCADIVREENNEFFGQFFKKVLTLFILPFFDKTRTSNSNMSWHTDNRMCEVVEER